jgi:large subunit ribosomal protein L31e
MIEMAEERTYIIPLRKEWLKIQKYKRSKKAVSAVKQFLAKHMKSDNVKIGNKLNLKIWERGIKNPPHKVKVSVIKEDDGTVKAELFGFKYKEVKVETKKKPKTKKEELMDKLGVKAEEKKEEAKEKKKEAKPEPKPEAPKKESKPEPKPEFPVKEKAE